MEIADHQMQLNGVKIYEDIVASGVHLLKDSIKKVSFAPL